MIQSKHSNANTASILIIAFLFGTIAPTWIQSTEWYAATTAGWVYEIRALAKPLSRMGS